MRKIENTTIYTFTSVYGGYDIVGKPGRMGDGGPELYPVRPDASLGEVVQYGHDDNAALESLIGDSTYVSSINYDYMGWITQLG